MITLYSKKEFTEAAANTRLPCKCYNCNKSFYVEKRYIIRELTHNYNYVKFCSTECKNIYTGVLIKTICLNCNKPIKRTISTIKRNKNNSSFCSQSCAASYNNAHKTIGTRISKLEKYIQSELIKLYDFEIKYNSKIEINSELDIYIASLQLAFELNGIFHYEPIFGQEKLSQIQNNDCRKFQACIEHNIELCIIDVTRLKYFKEQTAKKYLDIIINIINIKLR